jgi:Meiotically up-regulated gene 113
MESSTLYVLRSQSNHPQIAALRNVIHKIGVTGGKVDPTFLLADVEIIATYKLTGIKPSRLENLLHRFLGSARFEIEIADRFGNPVKPREWFLVPLPVIDEIVRRIQDHSILEYEYDRETAALQKIV